MNKTTTQEITLQRKIGINITAQLKMRGHNRQWLADKLNMSKASIDGYVMGTHNLSVNRLNDIATVLNVEVKELI